MLRIAVCDDEQITRNEIMRSLDDYARLRNIDIVRDPFATGADFLKSKRTYNVVIMDYQLDKDPQLNGISVAQKLRDINKDIAIIFLTSYPKIVFSSFEVNTFRFLVKPLDPQKLFKALDAFMKTLDTDMTLMIRLEGAVRVINTKQILFLEGDGKYCTIHMIQQLPQIECHETLANVEQRLPKQLFCRCHRSFIVNFKYVSSYDHQEVILRNGARVYISRNKYKLFEDTFIEYSRRYGY